MTVVLNVLYRSKNIFNYRSNKKVYQEGWISIGTESGNVFLIEFCQPEQSKSIKIVNIKKKNLDLPMSKIKFFYFEENYHLLVGSTFGYLIFYFDIEKNGLNSNNGTN